MNYFSFHIGDYMRDAAHLTNLEHGIYLRLLMTYYRDEGPKTTEQFARAIAARSEEEREVMVTLLGEFFKRDGDQWRHNRCDRDIEFARQKAAKASENGAKGGRPPKPSGKQVETEEEPNQNPEAPQTEPRQNPEETQGLISENPEETQKKADGFQTETETKPYPIANSQEPIPNSQVLTTTTATAGAQEPPWWQDDPDRVASEVGRVLSLFPESWGGDDLSADESGVRRLVLQARSWASTLGPGADEAILSSLSMFEDANADVIRSQKLKTHNPKPWLVGLRSWFESGAALWKAPPPGPRPPRESYPPRETKAERRIRDIKEAWSR